MEPASPKERIVLQLTKLKEVGDLKSALTSDMEMLSLEFAHLFFGLGLVQYFLIMTFWNGNVYTVIMKSHDLLFNFDFVGDYS